MATGTAGDSGRQYISHQTHYLRKYFTKADAGLTLDMGYLPPGAMVINRGVGVIEAFNAGTNNRCDIGPSTDTDGFAADVALGTVGQITTGSEMATSNDFYLTTAQLIQVVVDVTGTAATTGKAIAWVQYMVPEGVLGSS